MSDAPLRTEGSRSELVAKLYEKAEGWWHMGNAKHADAVAAIERLKAGDSPVRVGATLYVVTGE